MSEEISSQTLPPKARMNPQDFRNQDLVSRLLAATPPYLYSAPMAPHNFFFSEMLRSLVQAKNNEANRLQQATAANHMPASHHPHHHVGRRPRKRSWSHHRIPFEHQIATPAKEFEEKNEKPLELTTKSFEAKFSKREDSPIEKVPRFEENESRGGGEKVQSPIEASTPPPVDQSSATLASPTDLVLPPPPPVWYPSLYPPYGIDPLHFFIDLRVSGHIRSKENSSPSPSGFRADNNNSQFFDLESKNRHGSAFSIPTPREGMLKSPGAINLSATAQEGDDKDSLSKNTNYVMQNLPRIYTHLNAHHKIQDDQESLRQDSGGEGDVSGSESDFKRPSDEDVIAVDDNDN
ncbi:uncharacterized protein LOC132264852 [Phlebotomus argentipes]|uniref:uncharacterized protein LOC132264852 n=1 Tax=Phlebotomus argentipes TaxID=94469 RepID=UPI002893309A|nr:uncharacterized protein LOC132264852 [Phlebotomus argentipes]XP_059621167.1 uncharacterized protein LOC132264852 [Phlebotomus argentipes]